MPIQTIPSGFYSLFSLVTFRILVAFLHQKVMSSFAYLQAFIRFCNTLEFYEMYCSGRIIKFVLTIPRFLNETIPY